MPRRLPIATPPPATHLRYLKAAHGWAQTLDAIIDMYGLDMVVSEVRDRRIVGGYAICPRRSGGTEARPVLVSADGLLAVAFDGARWLVL